MLSQRSILYLSPKITGYPLIDKADKLLNPYVDNINNINLNEYDVIVEEDDMFN